MAKIHYATDYQPDFGFPWPEYTSEEIEALPAMEQARLAQVLPRVQDAAALDPIEYGFTLKSWRRLMESWDKYLIFMVLGGNRSSKSTYASRLMVWAALHIPEFRGRCFTVNDESSINDQQRFIWEAIPARFRETKPRKRGQVESLEYSQKNGFTGNKVIFPPLPGYDRGGEILFQTYRSYANDPQIAEGWWAHLVWNDEEVPQKLLETQIFRVTDAKGKIVNTFTTLQGWSPTVADILSKVKTLETRYASLVGKRVPYLQESLSRSRTLISYFWSSDNPWIPQADLINDLKLRPTEEKLARAYGIPTRAFGSKFPLFDELIHVVDREKLPWVKEAGYAHTRYMALDPGGSKNWFMMWVAIDKAGTVWVYDEWPGEDMEPWAEPGNDVKGKAGKGQAGFGYGIRDYIEVIKDVEQGTPVFERYIDSRMGNAEKHAKDGATSISIDLEDEDMPFMDAPGLDIEHGLQLINNKLAYDTDKPLSSTNAPALYVSDKCQNLIFGLKNFTGLGGKSEACKDPIDCLRYLLESRIEHVDAGVMVGTSAGGY